MTGIDQMGSTQAYFMGPVQGTSAPAEVSASPVWRQATFSLKSKHANPCTIATRERTDNQNTLYLGFEQQIIPGHLSYGIQVRTDVSSIPHFHQRSPVGGCFPRTRKDSSLQLHVRFALTDCKKIN